MDIPEQLKGHSKVWWAGMFILPATPLLLLIIVLVKRVMNKKEREVVNNDDRINNTSD